MEREKEECYFIGKMIHFSLWKFKFYLKILNNGDVIKYFVNCFWKAFAMITIALTKVIWKQNHTRFIKLKHKYSPWRIVFEQNDNISMLILAIFKMLLVSGCEKTKHR